MLTYVIVQTDSVEVYHDGIIAEARFNMLTQNGHAAQLFRRIPIGIPQELTDQARASIRKELAEVEALLTTDRSRRSDIIAAMHRAIDFVLSVNGDGDRSPVIDHMADVGPAAQPR